MSFWRPNCPGCGQKMYAHREKMGFEVATHRAWFQCGCGWKSPEKMGITPDEALLRATIVAQRFLLLKPLTCDEALASLNAGNPVWIEERYKEGGWNVPEGLNCVSITDDDKKQCGITWRPWATRPTDEERAAAKWEDADHD